MVHLQVLYRTRSGPDWGQHIYSPQWPVSNQYGPPDWRANDAIAALGHVREFDCRLFAFYFLITETLATYLGYRIAQHCLRGRGLHMLPTSLRIWIVFGYCALKIRVIDYVFHGSLYEIVTMITAFCFALCTLVAIVFHFGPMQFVFADFRRRPLRNKGKDQNPSTTSSNAARHHHPHRRFSFSHLLGELRNFIMKQHFHEYALELSSKRHRELGRVATTVANAPGGVVRVPWLIVGDVELHVQSWNDWLVRHIAKPLVAKATQKNKNKKTATACDNLDLPIMAESRFVVAMLSSGLLLDVLLKAPTPSMMFRLHNHDVYPFELVVRWTTTTTTTTATPTCNDRRVYFCYAECHKLVGMSTPTQKAAISAMLLQLNGMSGHTVDVPLRSLRCKDFISANCNQQVACGRTRAHGSNLSSQLESAFG